MNKCPKGSVGSFSDLQILLFYIISNPLFQTVIFTAILQIIFVTFRVLCFLNFDIFCLTSAHVQLIYCPFNHYDKNILKITEKFINFITK